MVAICVILTPQGGESKTAKNGPKYAQSSSYASVEQANKRGPTVTGSVLPTPEARMGITSAPNRAKSCGFHSHMLPHTGAKRLIAWGTRGKVISTHAWEARVPGSYGRTQEEHQILTIGS